jgi:hypothetical protein
LIAGFPKCGTTTLVHAFAAHNETIISLNEKCAIGGANHAIGPAYAKLTEVFAEWSPDPNIKRGVKCPISLQSHCTLSLLTHHSPETKLIIGVRHPVRFFESHYNYCKTKMYNKNQTEPIPPIETLTGGREWRRVSTQNARFDIFLLQLGNTNMTTLFVIVQCAVNGRQESNQPIGERRCNGRHGHSLGTTKNDNFWSSVIRTT